MSLLKLRQLRYELNTLFYYSFDNLSGDQRLAFQRQIQTIDDTIQCMEEF